MQKRRIRAAEQKNGEMEGDEERKGESEERRGEGERDKTKVSNHKLCQQKQPHY